MTTKWSLQPCYKTSMLCLRFMNRQQSFIRFMMKVSQTFHDYFLWLAELSRATVVIPPFICVKTEKPKMKLIGMQFCSGGDYQFFVERWTKRRTRIWNSSGKFMFMWFYYDSQPLLSFIIFMHKTRESFSARSNEYKLAWM